MSPVNVPCPLCIQPGQIYKDTPSFAFQGWCDRCGQIHITQEAVEEARRLNKLHVLSSWFRRNQRVTPMVPLVKRLDVGTIVADTPEYSPLEKLDRTLMEIASRTLQPGQRSQFTAQNDYPLVYAASPDEAAYYINQLAEVGYVKQDAGLPLISAKGFQRLEDLKKTGRNSSFAFVAMWFASSMNEVYDNAIAPAIRDAGYRPIRVDRVEHVNRIDDEIIGRIKASRFLVADFTEHRQGVYFEAGLMLGLGRTVIWMCKDEDLATSHFDTRQYNFIAYKAIEEARTRLYNRIMAIEGAGPEADRAPS